MLVHGSEQIVQPKRVVILGASGVIGRTLTPYLQKHRIPVRALGSQDLDLLAHGASDRLAALLHRNDALIVLAGLPPRRGRDLKTMTQNIDMGLAVCTALARQPVAHIVYMSSDAVYPRTVEEVTEESPTDPIDDPYSAMHLVRERLFLSLTRTPVSVLRSTQICAGNDTHDAYGPNRFRRTALSENRIVLFGRGEETRDHIMVEDVAAIIYRCLLHQSRGVMNVATGRSLTFAEVARQVSTHFDPRPEIVQVPRHMPVTHRRFDISVCVRAFPDLALTPLEQGLPRMMQQMAAQSEC